MMAGKTAGEAIWLVSWYDFASKYVTELHPGLHLGGTNKKDQGHE